MTMFYDRLTSINVESYHKNLLQKYGNDDYAISQFRVSPAPDFTSLTRPGQTPPAVASQGAVANNRRQPSRRAQYFAYLTSCAYRE